MRTPRCLLLNADFSPLAIISARRAVGLVYAQKAEMIEDSGHSYVSPSTSVKVPIVARLFRYIRIPNQRSVVLTTRTVLARDKYECGYCTKNRATTIDHIIPRSKGGPHTWENVIAACRTCNYKKGRKSLEDMGWILRFRPYRPRGAGAWMLAKKPESAWEPYLQIKEAA